MRRIALVIFCSLVLLLVGCPLPTRAVTRTPMIQEFEGVYYPIIATTTPCTDVSLNAALTAMQALSPPRTVLQLTPVDGAGVACTWTLAANVTVPRGITLRIPDGVRVAVNSGQTLTLDGPHVADDPDWFTGLGTVAINYRDGRSDGLYPYLVAGCLPTVPGASLTLSAFACRGNLVMNNQWYHQNQASATVGPLNLGDGTYWIALHKDTTTAVTGWTRQGSTAYLWKLATTQSPGPTGGVIFAKVTVSGSVITLVQDLRESNPLGQSTLNPRDPLWGCVGDGSTDDTTCWQTIANRVSTPVTTLINPANVTKIVVPSGVYCVTDAVSWERVIGLEILGQGGSWSSGAVARPAEIRWCGATGTGKAAWWFKEVQKLRITHLAFYGGRESLRFRRHEVCNTGAVKSLTDVTIEHNFFGGGEYAAIWIGFPLAGVTCDDDMTNFVIEHNTFDVDVGLSSAAQEGGCIVAYVQDNGYNLHIRENQMFCTQALVTQRWQNISVERNVIITRPYPCAAACRYPLYAISGAGYYRVIGNITENGLLLRMDNAWTGSAGSFAYFESNIVNSQELYAGVGINSRPTILTNTYTIFVNTKVSDAACTATKVRHISTGVAGGMTLGVNTCDIWDDKVALTQLGWCNQQGTDTSFVNGVLCLMQSTGSTPNKGMIIRRCDDTDAACTGARVFQVRRFDGASDLVGMDGNGRITSAERVIANRFRSDCITFAALGTVTNGEFGCCSNCNMGTNPCTGGAGTGSYYFGIAGVWMCPTFP